MAISKFQRNLGKPTYTCISCGHHTRVTGDPSAQYVELCEFCYEVAGEENSLQDGYIDEVQFEAFVLEAAERLNISPERARRGSGLTLEVLG